MYAKKNSGLKVTATLLAIVLLIGCAAGATLAWLKDSTTEVTNVFTTSDIKIELSESAELDLKMVPGKTITKDPKVTVKGGSEACWLFVQITEENNFDDYMSYEIADGWTPVTSNEGVYYREVSAQNADQEFPVLANNHVIVLNTVEKSDMETAKSNAPTLSFTAYAIQSANLTDNQGTALTENDVATIWAMAQATATNP